MNKLFTKVAALTLGVAMAAGVGVALGSSKKVESAFASDASVSWSDFGISGTTTKSNVTETASGVGFTLSSATGTNGISKSGTMTNTVAFSDSITKVTIVGAKFSAETKGECTVYVGASSGATTTSIGSFTTSDDYEFNASGSYTFVTLVLNNQRTMKFTSFVVTYGSGGSTTYSVSYNANATVNVDGSAPSAHTGLADGTTQTLETTTSLTRWGYTFSGWAATAESTTPITSVTIDGANATVYAIWTADLTVKGAHASNPYNVAEARSAIDAGVHLKANYVTGIISQIDKIGTSKGITYWISDDGSKTNQFEIYYGKNIGNTDFEAITDIALGATVVNFGEIKKFSSTYEFDNGSYLISYTAPSNPSIALSVEYLSFIVGGDAQSFTVVPTSFSDVPTVTIEGASHVQTAIDGLTVSVLPSSVGNDTLVVKATNGTEVAQIELDVRVFATHGHVEDDPYTVAEALALIASDTQYVFRDCYVKGLISQVVSYSSQYHSLDYDISDNGETENELLIYSGKGLNGDNFNSTDDLTVGYEVVVKGNLKYYSQKSEMDKNSVQISYKAPVPTAWTSEQEQTFKDNLDGYVPPYFAELSGDINVYGTLVQYNVKGDVVGAVNSYYEQQGWKSEVAGYWGHETTGGNGFVEANAQTSATGTIISFQYTEYAVVTLDENGTKTEVKVIPPFEYTLPSPTESLIPEGKEFKAWEIGGDYYDPDDKYDVSEDVTITAVYQDQAPDWSAAEKQALETALHGYLPPYFGELVEPLSTTENGATFTVSGDHSDEFATKLGDGWEAIDTENYVKQEDNYYLTASIYTYGVRLPVGDYSMFTFTYREGQLDNKYSVTYDAGQGTGEDIVINDVEEGSLHALKTFAETQFVAPEGQQFKGWQVGNDAELHDAGYEVTVNGDVTVTAIYEDIPVPTDWSETFKTTFQSRFKTTYLPPFVNAEFANESNQTWVGNYPYCKIEVEGNFYSNAATLFNNDSNWYFLGYDEYDCPIFMSADQKAFVIIDVYMKVEAGPVYTSLTFECVGDYAVVTTGAKTEYFVGDNLDLTNVKLCAQLLDGTIVENLTIPQSYWSVSPTTLTEAGDAVVITITVAALQEDFTYNVKVTPVMVESISISGELSKTEYTEGDAWDATGLVATAHYNNGAEEDVTAQVSWTFQPEETVAGTDSVSVVATLGEISSEAANFDVVVNEPVPTYDADAFAKDLLEMVAPICNNYDGKKNNKVALKGVWDTMSQRYSTLSDDEKAKVIAAAAKTDGTDLEKAMAFYNYACKKYGLTKFIEGRQVKALVAEHETGNCILPIVVIVASSVAAITAIGVVIALKRRKALLAK